MRIPKDHNEPSVKRCQHCEKQYEVASLIGSTLCPHCKKDLRLAPKPDKGQFVDQETVTDKNLVRIDDWAIKIMQKHEHLFSKKIPVGKIFIQEELKPEDVDIPQIYDFCGLSYEIFRKLHNLWAVRIMQNGKIVVEAAYEKILKRKK